MKKFILFLFIGPTIFFSYVSAVQSQEAVNQTTAESTEESFDFQSTRQNQLTNESDQKSANNTTPGEVTHSTFEAVVLEVLATQEVKTDNGGKTTLQKLRLKGLNGEFKNQEFIFDGIGKVLTTKASYSQNEKIMVTSTVIDGEETFDIVDKVRYPVLYWLIALFALTAIVIGRKKGFFSLVGLTITLLIILKFTVPRITAGADPLIISIISALPILLVSIYVTHGLNRKSSIALIGTFGGAVSVGVLSLIFSSLTHLTGFASEETLYLSGIFQESVGFKNLLLGSFVIGALGILDDIAVTQASVVQELVESNPKITRLELYRRSMAVGVDHISSIVNTLFLAYAGVSFPLLLLFNLKQPPFESITHVINNEIVATEIIRTLVGSLGLFLTVPITTLVATYIYTKQKALAPIKTKNA